MLPTCENSTSLIETANILLGFMQKKKLIQHKLNQSYYVLKCILFTRNTVCFQKSVFVSRLCYRLHLLQSFDLSLFPLLKKSNCNASPDCNQRGVEVLCMYVIPAPVCCACFGLCSVYEVLCNCYQCIAIQ